VPGTDTTSYINELEITKQQPRGYSHQITENFKTILVGGV